MLYWKDCLASEIGNAVLDKGARVIYITIDNLLLQYKYKKKQWDFILNCDVVVIDELFYVQPTDEELLAIYKILIFLQETRTLILITNRALFTSNRNIAKKTNSICTGDYIKLVYRQSNNKNQAKSCR